VRRPRRAARSFWRSGQAKAKGHTNMRLTCGFPAVVCGGGACVVCGGICNCFSSPAGPGPPGPRAAENQSRVPSPGVGGASYSPDFRNPRISLSAGRRACEPAAKPAIPGVILLRNGFVWPERTPVPYQGSTCCHSPAPPPAERNLRFTPDGGREIVGPPPPRLIVATTARPRINTQSAY
jgi:hypothetical protein